MRTKFQVQILPPQLFSTSLPDDVGIQVAEVATGDSFVFCGTKDKQYQQVGNAVPPIMAEAIAKKIAKLLKKQQNAGDDNNGC